MHLVAEPVDEGGLLSVQVGEVLQAALLILPLRSHLRYGEARRQRQVLLRYTSLRERVLS